MVVKPNVQEDHIHLEVLVPPRNSVVNEIWFTKTQLAKNQGEISFYAKNYARKGGI